MSPVGGEEEKVLYSRTKSSWSVLFIYNGIASLSSLVIFQSQYYQTKYNPQLDIILDFGVLNLIIDIR